MGLGQQRGKFFLCFPTGPPVRRFLSFPALLIGLCGRLSHFPPDPMAGRRSGLGGQSVPFSVIYFNLCRKLIYDNLSVTFYLFLNHGSLVRVHTNTPLWLLLLPCLHTGAPRVSIVSKFEPEVVRKAHSSVSVCLSPIVSRPPPVRKTYPCPIILPFILTAVATINPCPSSPLSSCMTTNRGFYDQD